MCSANSQTAYRRFKQAKKNGSKVFAANFGTNSIGGRLLRIWHCTSCQWQVIRRRVCGDRSVLAGQH